MSRATNDTIYVLTGCTAVGKTKLALEWAETHNAEIVSCDSLLFYRGMDIGTAKPTRAERDQVPHHLIDIREASKRMDIADYVPLAMAVIEDIRARGKSALVTGGSGFYLKAFFEPVLDDVSISDSTRRAVQMIEREKGLDGMVEALEKLDPQCRETLDIRNSRRVFRGLERCLETGKSLKELKNELSKQKNALTESPKKLVILERETEELNERIRIRVSHMLEGGLVAEVERLKAEGFEANASGSGSIGYRETLAYINHDYDIETLASSIETNTRRLAKKQRTWFRTQLPVGKAINLSGDSQVAVDPLFE